MTQGNSRVATGVTPGTADASAYAPLRHPVFRALWLASLASNRHCESGGGSARQARRPTSANTSLVRVGPKRAEVWRTGAGYATDRSWNGGHLAGAPAVGDPEGFDRRLLRLAGPSPRGAGGTAAPYNGRDSGIAP
jgi:hypothetical protein